jgi:hypothetical protein
MKETGPIDIVCYREDKDGKSAFFDHFDLQTATGRPTRAVGVFNGGRALLRAIHEQPFNLPHCNLDTLSQRPTPPLLDLEAYLADDHPGLLFIPGEFEDDRSGADTVQRSAIQGQILKCALRGCPILAACEGALFVWKNQGGDIQEVRDHTYSRMPSITTKGRIGYNITIHRLRIERGSILEAAMSGGNSTLGLSPSIKLAI